MKLDAIQGLRAFAAYLVLFYHIRAMELKAAKVFRTDDVPLIGGLFKNGYAGVDLFFVISGFIMVFVTLKRPETLSTVKDFVVARIIRIYPPWWLFSGALAVFFFFSKGGAWHPTSIAPQGTADLDYLLRSFFLLPQNTFPILGVGWTLVHEMFFYVVFSVILLAPRKQLPVWLCVWALVTVFGALSGFASTFASDFLHLIFHTMTLEFIAGAFAGWLIISGYVWRPGLIFTVGLVGLLVVLFIHPHPTPFTLKWGRMLAYTLPCALLVYGAAGLNSRFNGPLSKVLARLGDYSFALYLSHTLVLVALNKIFPVLANTLQTRFGASESIANLFRLGSAGIADNILFTVTCVIASTLVAALTYHLFEQPVLKILSQLFRKRDKETAREN